MSPDLQDLEVDIGTQVVNVADEHVLLASFEEFVQQAGVADGVEDVTVARRIPLALLGCCTARNGEEGLLADTGVTGLVEGEDLDVVVGILLDDTLSLIVGIERVHQDERDVGLVSFVEVLSGIHASRFRTLSISGFTSKINLPRSA